MGEIRTSDLQEMGWKQVEGFKDIKPVENTELNEAASYWNKTFDSLNQPENQYTEEKVDFKSDQPLDNKNENPRYIITRNERLENDVHPYTGVPFERRIVTLPSGEKIEGVFPKFDSMFDAKIEEELYLESDAKQFKECNKQLLEAIETNPVLKSKFTDEQIEQIRDGVLDGTAPDGYVWHHDAEAGKIQLVDSYTHAITGHTGGRFIWGGGSEGR